MSKFFLIVGAVLSMLLMATSSIADPPDLQSGKRITSSGDWRLEHRDAIIMAEDVFIIGDVCTLITGTKNAWLSFGLKAGFVNVTVYAKAWDNPRRSRTIQLSSSETRILMAGAVFDGEFIQTSLPPNEAPEKSVRMLAEAARQSHKIELRRMPGKKLMATFSGRGLETLLDRAIQCSHKSRK